VPEARATPIGCWLERRDRPASLTYFNGREDTSRGVADRRGGSSAADRALPGRGAHDAPRQSRARSRNSAPSILGASRYMPTGGLNQRQMKKAISARRRSARQSCRSGRDAAYLKKAEMAGLEGRLSATHAPTDEDDLSPMHTSRGTPRLDEAAGEQLADRAGAHHNRTLAGSGDQGRRRTAEARDGGPALSAPASSFRRRRFRAEHGKHERMVR